MPKTATMEDLFYTVVGSLFLTILMYFGIGVSEPRQTQPKPTPPATRSPVSVDATAKTSQFGELTGKLIHIVDGDTADILTEEKETIRIRFAVADCPETGQPFGKNAKQFVSDHAGGRTVRVVITDKDLDRHGRTVGEIFVDGVSLNVELIRAGLAWHFVKYAPNRDDAAEAEREARAARSGLWAGSHKVIAPWDWRKMGKAERDRYR